MKTKYWVMICIFLIVVGILAGFFLKSFSMQVVEQTSFVLMSYACADGCSIATQDSDGFLTNETMDCWDECDIYINKVWNDYAKEQRSEQ